MTGTRYDEGFADGVEYAARMVVKHLQTAFMTPRSHQPTDRRGKIVALGLLLQDLAPGIDYTDPNADEASQP